MKNEKDPIETRIEKLESRINNITISLIIHGIAIIILGLLLL